MRRICPVGGGGGGGLMYCIWRGGSWLVPVITQSCVLDLHDLFADLPKDLLPPLVCFHHIMALCGQVWPLLLWLPGFLLL